MTASIQVTSLHVCQGTMKNYSYIVYQNGLSPALIIDPAWELEKYLAVFQEKQLKPQAILLTHLHLDHTHLVSFFQKKYQLPVYASIEAKEIATHFFHHEQTLLFSTIPCTSYSTPGHTPESSCFLIGEHLFTGDTLFIEGCGMCFEESSNPKALYKSLQFLKKTISPQTKIYPGHRYGQYPGVSFKDVLDQNLYLNIQDEERFIQFRMRPKQYNLFNFL